MNLKDTTRQSVLGLFTVNRSVAILSGAVVILILALFFYISNQETSPKPTPVLSTDFAAKASTEQTTQAHATSVWAPQFSEPRIAEGPGADPVLAQPTTRERRSEPQATLSELESQFRSTYNQEEKKDLLRLIAGWNNRDAVAVLTRLFQAERHPDARQAVLVALGDVDPSEGVQERLALLTFATQKQPRDVRMAALDLLDSIDDARSTKLIQQLMRNDPDREVREAAKVIYDSKSPER